MENRSSNHESLATWGVHDETRRIKVKKKNTYTDKTRVMSNTDSTKIKVSEHNKYKFILSLYTKGY